MPKLQELLLLAGWTLEYADADAIGGGSSEDPAWDMTPEANTDAGVAVYRMPLNDHTTQWFVRVRPGWGAFTNRIHMRGMQVGTGHTGGAVSGGSTEMTPDPGGVSNGLEWQIAVSEDGFCFVAGATNATPAFAFERARLADGSVADDAWGFNKYTSTAAGYAARHVSVSVGEVSDAPPFALLPHQFGVVGSAIPSAESQDATRVMALGPYLPGGSSLFAPPRLYAIGSPVDVTGDSERVINVDGGDKTYRAMSSSVLTSIGIVLVATE